VTGRQRPGGFTTRLAGDAARRPGPWQDQPHGTIYRQIVPGTLPTGGCPRPSYCSASPANLVVIEGHKPLTLLLLCPQRLRAGLDARFGTTAITADSRLHRGHSGSQYPVA
jgi:hypothetical protein